MLQSKLIRPRQVVVCPQYNYSIWSYFKGAWTKPEPTPSATKQEEKQEEPVFLKEEVDQQKQVKSKMHTLKQEIKDMRRTS